MGKPFGYENWMKGGAAHDSNARGDGDVVNQIGDRKSQRSGLGRPLTLSVSGRERKTKMDHRCIKSICSLPLLSLLSCTLIISLGVLNKLELTKSLLAALPHCVLISTLKSYVRPSWVFRDKKKKTSLIIYGLIFLNFIKLQFSVFIFSFFSILSLY